MRDRQESVRIQNEIRQILLTVWDPIGVKDEPNAQDEYDSYVFEIFNLLAKRATDHEITKWLLYITNARMGLNAKAQDMQATISALREISL